MNLRRFHHSVLLLAAVTAMVFTIDLSIELGVASGVLYIAVIWLAYATGRVRRVWVMATVCSLLTLVGMVMSPPGSEMWKVLANRGLALIAIWMTTGLCMRVLKLSSDQTERAEAAEQMVDELARRREEDARRSQAITKMTKDLREEQRKLRAEVAERQRLSDIVASSGDAIIGTTPEGIVTSWNDGAELLYGYTAEEMVGQPVARLTPDHRAHEMAGMLARLRRGESAHDYETVRVCKDGRRLDVSLVISPIWDSQEDQVVGASTIERDMTDSKRFQARLERMNLELERSNLAFSRSNAELDQFVYVASHDLSAPLRAIDNLAKWIAQDAGDRLPAECRQHINKMQQRVERMERLLSDLLDYSRAGRLQYEAEVVDTGRLVEEIIELVAPPEAFAVTVADVMPTLKTVRPPLEQVLMNLITNAIKHHDKPSGRIDVSAVSLGDCYEFSVTDDGPGIDPKFHERVFDMFQTLRPRDKVEGSGMGLAVIKKVVEGFGGSVQVESAVGSGTTFRFTWPTGEATEEVTEDEEQFAHA